MQIREATEKDIPEIVEVLKASLGEEDLLLSEEVWRYKHLENPFGKSIVLLALENEQIIGVRAFMRWKWQKGEKLYSALRAVDTATHPAHQGKGIFKKLTLQAVDIAKKEGVHFIFNTPNEKSRPGYLKMGWEQVGKIAVGLTPSLNFLNSQSKRPINLKEIGDEEIQNLCVTWNENQKGVSHFFTPKSAAYLNWRYELNPLQEYSVLATKGLYMAAYIKKRYGLQELRIVEGISTNRGNFKEGLKRFRKKLGGHLISFSPTLQELPGIKGNFGPVLTANSLNLITEEKSQLLSIEKWNSSLGDLELF